MSDRVHRRQPATLPEGYQYGDAVKCRFDKIYGAMCSTCWREMVYQPVLHAWVCQTCTARILLPWTADCFKEAGWRIGDTIEVSFDWYRCPKCAHTWRLASTHPALPNCPQPSCRFPLAPWRAPHENAAAQLKRRQQEGGAAIAKHFSDEANARMFRLSCPDLEERTGAEPV